MAQLTPLSLDDARRLGAAYGLEIAEVDALAAGSVNSNFRLSTAGGRAFFGRIYEEQGARGAWTEAELSHSLAMAGVPTPSPIELREGGYIAEHAGKPVAIYPWIDGGLLCQARVDAAAAGEVGAALARVHTSGVRVAGEGRFRVADIEARLGRIELEAPAELAVAVPLIRGRLAHYAPLRDPDLPQGLIHGDLFRDNVLWSEGRILALIDFESAARGAFAYDVMVTLLAWCFSDRFEPELCRALLSRYHALRPLEGRELDALCVEGAIACLRFATTRITDFAMRAPPGQPPVRDYRRFLARLVELEKGAIDDAVAALRR